MSTHYIEEAERLADTVTIMSHGTAVATGPPRRAGRRARRAPRRSRSTGRRRKLAEVEARRPGRAGTRTRRTGTSVAVLGSTAQRTSEGERRPANLEDVFVLLTGEEIA